MVKRPRSSPKPKYIQIADELENRILDGIYRPRDALPTFKELARAHDVSVVTINHAIRELDTRGRIIRQRGKAVYIAEREGKKDFTHNIGFIVPDIADPYYSSLAKKIGGDLLDRHYALITHSTENDSVRLNRCMRDLLKRRVDGIILVPNQMNWPEHEAILWKLKLEAVPFVYLGYNYFRVPTDYVIVNRRLGVKKMLRHLLELGHRNIACISAEPRVKTTVAKVEAFVRFMRENDLECPEDNVVISRKYRDEGGYDAALRLFRKTPRPTAVFTTSDFVAIGIIRAAKSLHLRIPEDVSVAGFNDIELARIFEPALTTVAQPIEKMADLATDILFQRIKGVLPVDFQHHVLNPTLVVRESTAALSPRAIAAPAG